MLTLDTYTAHYAATCLHSAQIVRMSTLLLLLLLQQLRDPVDLLEELHL